MLPVFMACAVALATDDSPEVDLAEESDLHFEHGVTDYKAGRFEEALEHLLLSHRLVPNRNVVFNIARAYEQLERYDRAYRHYAEFVRIEDDPEERAEAEKSLDRISGDVARTTVESVPSGATVYLTRKDLGSRGSTPMTLALAEGSHTLLVELDGHKTAEVEVEMTVGEVTPVSVELKKTSKRNIVEPLEPPVADAWSTAEIRAGETVLLEVSVSGCSLMPGTLDAVGAPMGTLGGAASGSAVAASGPATGLAIDWTLGSGATWRHSLPRAGKKDLWLQDAAPLRSLLASCDPAVVAAGDLADELGTLPMAELRDAIALFAEWAALRGAVLEVGVLDDCAKGSCTDLAKALVR